MNSLRFCVCVSLLLVGCHPMLAQGPPSYAKQIQPLFAKYCSACHNAKKPRAGLNLESYEGLRQGSDNGPVLIPGKADASLLVLLTEGKKEPRMPPKKAEVQPTAAEVALLRAWVNAGAKLDQTVAKIILPAIPSRVKPAAPITALAYLDKDRLAVGRYQELLILNLASGEILRRDEPGIVTALAVSRDGKSLAVGCGTPGTPAILRICTVPPAGQLWQTPREIAHAHADVIQRLVFRPDGQRLLSASYDRQIKSWEVVSAKEIKTLREHSDSVYGLAYRPDGKLFASAAADRAVKVWDAETGKLLYTLGENTDWVYAAAWSPDGKQLAAGGVDKSIRVWEVTAESGKVAHSVFAHQGPIVQLAYSPDGQTLYSVSEDRTIKAWDTTRMVERRVYPPQSEALLSLALRPDGQQLAVGRYDGQLVLIDTASGKMKTKPLPAPAKQVRISKSPVEAPPHPQPLSPHAERGEQDIHSTPSKGERKPSSPLASVHRGEGLGREEMEPNNSPGTGQTISWPTVVAGQLNRMGDVDYYRFEAKAGQELGVKVVVGDDKKAAFEPFLQLTDAQGIVLARSDEEYLGYTFRKAGIYALGIRDQRFRGGSKQKYQLHIGAIPVVTAIFPLGLQRGSEADIQVEGVNLPLEKRVVHVKAGEAAPGTRLPVALPTAKQPLGMKQVLVGEFPEMVEAGDRTMSLTVPGTANGRIAQPGETDVWKFTAQKGQQMILEVNARRLGSRLDSFIEILDSQGQPVPRAALRSLAKTFVTFRDHNSVQPNIRIDAWSELAVNDYVYVGTDLLRIRALPTHPDADCNFFSDRGQRVGYLDTTPTQLSMGEPMYKVEIHPPGTQFPPNGFPVVTIYYRNDDGGPGFGRDSQLTFEPPADGEYQVRIGDSRGQSGSNYAYRLTVRPPRPGYKINFSPTTPTVSRGSGLPITVTAERSDGYEGPIEVKLENLPAGLSAPDTFIPAGENSTSFALWAAADAKNPGKVSPLKLTAQADINGQTVRKEATGGVPKVVAPGDIVTTTKESAITLKPGGSTHLTVTIERRNNFKGRVPIEVQGLPHGVKVLDIGLNGILITEQETTRTMEIYSEPWVQPMQHPIVIFARREGPNTQHAARSVLLKIEP